MARFLKPNDLINELRDLFSEAQKELTIVTPFINLNDDIKSILKKKINDSELQLRVVFGKNKKDLSISLSQDDFDFFKQFQNIEIRYVENLHAKYYANEYKSIITSLNLHSFSIKNNIEIGVLFEQSLSGTVLNLISQNLAKDSNTDNEAYEYFSQVIENSEIYFEKRAKMKSSLFGLVNKQDGNIIEVDNSSRIYSSSNSNPKLKSIGYCIRTGVEIPFNIKYPFTKASYESWAKYENKNYKEKYCHFSGEFSNGETNSERPVLRKNYKEAKLLQKKLHN